MNQFEKAYYVLRYLGPQIIWLRAGVYLRKALGITARVYRPRPWEQIQLGEITLPGTPTSPADYAQFKREHTTPFLFALGEPPDLSALSRVELAERQPDWDERLKLLDELRPVYFLRLVSPTPADWHVNPLEGKRSDPTLTWCNLPDFSAEQGDMRMLWEPSRAAWAIDIAKAKARKAPIDAASLFWQWLDSWMEASPPYLGFQWKCGQESSVRWIALSLGFQSIALDVATTPERWVQFARMTWATGYRVAHHINYAISQSNNHSMSEAVGLMMIALQFPEFRESKAWWEKGRAVLGWDIRRQVAADGTYLQSSMNYERVMLQVCMLGLRLAELAREPLERDAYETLGRCSEFLYQCMEPSSGRLPNYGSNDGAYVLPMSECDFTDYRPALQAVHFLVHRRRLFEPGPWDEDLLWLFGPESLDSPGETQRLPVSSAFLEGGYYTLRTTDSWALMRCHTYHHRPDHCDQLGVDLWWRGQNVLRDCGSYHYYVPGRPDIEFYFRSVQSHNTIELDRQNYLESGGRFLWFPWPRAAERLFTGKPDPSSGVLIFEGEHYGYDRPPWHVVHRRTVMALPGDLWAIVDDLLGSGTHRALLRWHMMDAPVTPDARQQRLRLDTPRGPLFMQVCGTSGIADRFEIIRGRDEPGRVQGFASEYFGEMLPIPTLECEYSRVLPMRIVTVLSPEAHTVTLRGSNGEDHLKIEGADTIRLARLQAPTPRTFLGVGTEKS